MRNSYDGLLDPWKRELITKRAKRLRMRQEDIDDAEQEIALALMEFQYVKEKPNGGSESTTLTTIIDRQLRLICRSEARQRKRAEQCWSSMPAREHAAEVPSCEGVVSTISDVRQALASLDERAKAVCQALAQGTPVYLIGKSLGLKRYTVERIIEAIGQRFSSLGLDGQGDAA